MVDYTTSVFTVKNAFVLKSHTSGSSCADGNFIATLALKRATCVRNYESLAVFPAKGGAVAKAWRATAFTALGQQHKVVSHTVRVRSYATIDCSDSDYALVDVDWSHVTESIYSDLVGVINFPAMGATCVATAAQDVQVVKRGEETVGAAARVGGAAADALLLLLALLAAAAIAHGSLQ